MTDKERQEFNRRKREAERQLNNMYYGNQTNAEQGTGLKMPPFLSPARNTPPKITNNQTEKSTDNANTPKQSEERHTSKNTHHSKGLNLLNLLNFKGMQMDNDRLIILALCLLLSGEEADELLLLALMYIML